MAIKQQAYNIMLELFDGLTGAKWVDINPSSSILEEINVDIYQDGDFVKTRNPDGRISDNLIIINLSGGLGGETDANSIFLEFTYTGVEDITIPSIQILLDPIILDTLDSIKSQTDQLDFVNPNPSTGKGEVISNVNNNTDKTGYSLSPTGLDNISATEPSGRASTFREMIVQTWMRFFNKVDKNATQIKVYDDSGTVNTTQTHTTAGSTTTIEEAS